MMRARILTAAFLMALLLLPACTIHRPVDSIRASGDVHFARAEYTEAAREYKLIVDRYPGDWRAQYRLGQSLLQLDDPQPARRALEIAHTQRPMNNDIAEALAEAMFRVGDEPQLYAFLRERADSQQSPEAHMQLGYYSMELGDPDSARVAFDTAIALDEGQSVEPYLAAASFSERLGDMDMAVYRLRQGYGINPYDARIRDRLRALGEVPGPTIALPPGR